jgi:hypothetical protein
VHKFQESDIEINQCCFGWKQDKTVSIGLLSIVRQSWWEIETRLHQDENIRDFTRLTNTSSRDMRRYLWSSVSPNTLKCMSNKPREFCGMHI